MLPDRVSNPGPLTYESGALPTALHDPADEIAVSLLLHNRIMKSNIQEFVFNGVHS